MIRRLACVAAAALGALAIVHGQQGTPPRGGIVPPPPDFEKTAIQVLPVQGKVSMLLGGGGNVAVQAGPDGVLLVDAQLAPAAPKLFAAIRALSDYPIHTIINTHLHADHTAGTGALVKMRGAGPQAVRVMAHENVLRRLQEAGSNGAELRINAAVTLPVTITYDT